jgi:short-subunit dehydrogenase
VFDCKGKVALVTGASAGLGVEFAKQLAKRGADVILVARRKDRLEQLAQQIESSGSQKAYVLEADLAKPGAAKEIRSFVENKKLAVDILVNNAGFGTYGPFIEQSCERELEEISLNVSTLVALCHEFAPDMVKRKGGAVINVSSIAGFQPVGYMAVYAATKAFVLSFTEALWAELKPLGVRVLAVCPGPVETEFHEVAGNKKSGSMETVEHCVRMSMAALDAENSHVVTGGISNFLLTALGRVATRSFAAETSARIMKPASKPNAER